MLKKAKSDKSLLPQVELLEKCKEVLSKGQPVRVLHGKVDAKELKNLQLLTSKPVLFVCNVLENEAATGNSYSEKVDCNGERAGCK